jgi:hypothetical protein
MFPSIPILTRLIIAITKTKNLTTISKMVSVKKLYFFLNSLKHKRNSKKHIVDPIEKETIDLFLILIKNYKKSFTPKSGRNVEKGIFIKRRNNKCFIKTQKM